MFGMTGHIILYIKPFRYIETGKMTALSWVI